MCSALVTSEEQQRAKNNREVSGIKYVEKRVSRRIPPPKLKRQIKASVRPQINGDTHRVSERQTDAEPLCARFPMPKLTARVQMQNNVEAKRFFRFASRM